jgi:hypothetical protein
MKSGLKERATTLIVAARIHDGNGKSKTGKKSGQPTTGCPLKTLGLRCGCDPHSMGTNKNEFLD